MQDIRYISIILGFNIILISSLLYLLSNHRKKSWAKQESAGGRLGSVHAFEQVFTNGLLPVFCLAFGYDVLLLIDATLSQESLFLLATAAKIIQVPNNFISVSARSNKKQTMKLCV